MSGTADNCETGRETGSASRERGCEALVARLCAEPCAVPRHAPDRSLALGLGLGAAATLLALVLLFGIRPDLAAAMATGAFWMKTLYTGALATLGILACRRLARPDCGAIRHPGILALPVLLLIFIALAELAATGSIADWLTLGLGRSWQVCTRNLFLLALPLLAGLGWALRRLAPTRLRLAGACAGLVAGAGAALLYGLHCTETSALFVLTWYTLGIASSALLGGLLGPRLLRW